MARMAGETAELFSALGRRGYEPLLFRANGTLRIELADGRKTDRWLVAVSKGNVSVSRGGGPADCVFRGQKALFDRLASGQANAAVALLRGDLTLEGDYNLGVLFQRLFPGPRSSRRRRPARAGRGT
jgi:SCP-2 sterol transfer family protein